MSTLFLLKRNQDFSPKFLDIFYSLKCNDDEFDNNLPNLHYFDAEKFQFQKRNRCLLIVRFKKNSTSAPKHHIHFLDANKVQIC